MPTVTTHCLWLTLFLLYLALQALAFKAQFDAAAGNESVQEPIVNQIKTLVGSHPTASVQLTASQVLLAAGQTKEALQCIHLGSTMEQIEMKLQIFIKIDRLDLAREQLQLLKQADEDSILAQLGSVYVHLATGSTGSADAVHSLNSLTEQYGPSTLLLNLMACALMQQGDFSGAEQKLEECVRDHPETPMADTLLNLICCSVHQNKSANDYVAQMKQQYPTHAFLSGLDRVTSAFDREAVKYKV